MTITLRSWTVGVCLAGLAAAASADTLILRDGTRVQGTVIAFTADTLTFRGADGFAHNYHTDLVDTLSFLPVARPRGGGAARRDGADQREGREPAGLDVPSGTDLMLRTVELIDSSTAAPEQTFVALVEPGGPGAAAQPAVPAGASVQLVVRTQATAGASGAPEVTLAVQSVAIDGRRYDVATGAQLDDAPGAGRDTGALALARGGAVRLPAGTVLRLRFVSATTLRARR